MTWSFYLGAALIGGSLYWFALVGYRLYLSLRGLKIAGVPLKSTLDQLSEPIERDFAPAKNHTTEDLSQVLAKRKQLKRAKQDAAETRRRRLIERLNEMNLDKR